MDEGEWRSLLRASGKRVGAQKWTSDDLPLLDEAEFLINGRTRTYGHVVVDEAQDLSPMQFKMVARRAPAGSLTVLGDLAQATGPWSYESWDEIPSPHRASKPPAPSARDGASPALSGSITLSWRPRA